MTAPILATKLHQPALHPKHVQRARLLARLDEGLAAGRGLTLVSAPAGFGKTCCVSEWLGSLRRPVGWLSLEAADDDPLRFFLYFLAALQRFDTRASREILDAHASREILDAHASREILDARVGRELEGVLRAGELPPVEVLTAALVNDLLLLEQPVVLVCDDFHHIQDASILAVLERLINQRLEQLHLVLVTREDPLLPLARLRANDRLTEIRAGDLRFSSGEAGDFLSGMLGLTLTPADLAALEQRTEGWAVGLQLAGLSLRGRSDHSAFIASLNGSHRYILSYLTEEVLGRQSAETQAFLLQTSILERLTGELCDAVTGGQGAGELLERLFNANLFLIPLDDEQRWYRYHHLFADLLRSQQNHLPAGQVAELHRRASRWYAESGLPSEAIGHALAAADYPQAVSLLEKHATSILIQGYVKTVEGWMQAIPAEWHAHSPRANLAFGWMHLLRGNYERVAGHIQQVEAALAAGAGAAAGEPGEDAVVRAELLALQANLGNVQGRPAEGIKLAQQALALAAPGADYVRGQAYLALGGGQRLLGNYEELVTAYQQAIQHSRAANNVLGETIAVAGLVLMAEQRGALRMAMQVASALVERAEASGSTPPPISGTIYGALGMIEYQWNRLELAETHFQRSLQLAQLGGHNAGMVYSKLLLARLAMARGELESAARATQEAAEAMHHGVPAWLKPDVLYQQVRLHLARRQPEQAELLLQTAATAGGPLPPQAGPMPDLMVLAGLRLVLYHAEHPPLGETSSVYSRPAAIQQASRLIEQASAAHRMGIVIQARLLRARLYQQQANLPAALDDLCQAVALAEPEGYLRVFIEEGPPLADLLRACLAQSDSHTAAYLRQILAIFSTEAEQAGVGQVSQVGKEDSPIAQLVEPLSEREIEVLSLIAEGLKYQEVATRLVVSLNTVRFHVKMIYGKLGVNNRTRAIELARALGVIQ